MVLTKRNMNKLQFFIILVSHVVFIHPGSHPKQVPFCMWQVLSLQFVGHRSVQLFPYTPGVLQPKNILGTDIKLVSLTIYLFCLSCKIYCMIWLSYFYHKGQVCRLMIALFLHI